MTNIPSTFAKYIALSLLFCATTFTEETTTLPPNIVIIMVDDLGYGDTGCYGSKSIQTPSIDSLAKEGMRFTQFYAGSSCCSPSRAALLTGRYPDHVGVPGLVRFVGSYQSWGYLDENAVLLPEMLKTKSYHSALVGKWHLGEEDGHRPMQRGFDYFQGFLTGMLQNYDFDKIKNPKGFMKNDTPVEPSGHATETFTDWAITYLESRKDKPNPFYLQLSYTAPHIPIQPPESYVKQVRERMPDADKNVVRYTAFVEHLDHEIGRFLKTFHSMELDKNTILFFMSDNGGVLRAGASNAPFRGAKMTMFEGGLRVPMIAVWPENIKAGTVCDDIVMMMDIVPTVCELAGIKIDHPVDGRSFTELLNQNEEKLPERTNIWAWRNGRDFNGNAAYAVRRGNWKMLQTSPTKPFKLYNLLENVAEDKPVSESKSRRKELFEAIEEHIQLSGTVPWQAPMNEIMEVRAKLSEEELRAVDEEYPEGEVLPESE